MIKRIITSCMIVVFGLTSVVSQTSWAQVSPFSAQTHLPPVGAMVSVTDDYRPVVMRGLKLVADQPFRFDFLLQTGQSGLESSNIQEEALKLIHYFYASLTIPEKDMWVNLSPYEKDRIIPESFGLTEMGRDLLAQDYILKQLTASLMNPEGDIGKAFWEKVYERIYQSDASGNNAITNDVINSFNKVWILPDKAVVYAEDDQVYVVKSSLKVMLESDYEASRMDAKSRSEANGISSDVTTNDIKDLIRQIILPEIEQEVNEGKNFAPLRQIYHSLILAQWFKNHLKESVLGRLYVDQKKISGIDLDDVRVKQDIYQKYLESFKTGVYNLIKEEYDPSTQSVVPRKYFSGGLILDVDVAETRAPAALVAVVDENPNEAMLVVRADGRQTLKESLRSKISSVWGKTVSSYQYWASHQTLSLGLTLVGGFLLASYGASILYLGAVIFFAVPSIVAFFQSPVEDSPWILPRDSRRTASGSLSQSPQVDSKERFPWTGPTSGWRSELFKDGANDETVKKILESKDVRPISTKAGGNLEQLAAIAALNRLIEKLGSQKSQRMRQVVKQLKAWQEMVDNDRRVLMVFGRQTAGIADEERFVSAFLRKNKKNVARVYLMEDLLRQSMQDVFASVSEEHLQQRINDVYQRYQYANVNKRVNLDRWTKSFEFDVKAEILRNVPNAALMEVFLQGALESVGAKNSHAATERILSDWVGERPQNLPESLQEIGKEMSLDYVHQSKRSALETLQRFYSDSFSNSQGVRSFLKANDPEVISVGLSNMDDVQNIFHSLKGVAVYTPRGLTIVPPDVAWKQLTANFEQKNKGRFVRVFKFLEGPLSDIAVIEFYDDRVAPVRDQLLWEYKNLEGKKFLKSIQEKNESLRSLKSYNLSVNRQETVNRFERDLKSDGYRVYDLSEKKFVSRRDVYRKLNLFYKSGTVYRSDEHKVFIFESGLPKVQSTAVSTLDVEESVSEQDLPKAESKPRVVRGVTLGAFSSQSMKKLQGSSLFKGFKLRVEGLNQTFKDPKLSRDNKVLYDQILSFKQYIWSLQNDKLSDSDLTPVERVFLQTFFVEKDSTVSLIKFNNLIGDVFTIEEQLWGWIQTIKMGTKKADEFVDLVNHWMGLLQGVEEGSNKLRVVKRKGYQMFDLQAFFDQDQGAWGQNLSQSEILKYLYRKLDPIIDDLRQVKNIKEDDIDGLLQDIIKLPDVLRNYQQRSKILAPSERRLIDQLLKYDSKDSERNISLNSAADLARSFLNLRKGTGAPSYNPDEGFDLMIEILVNIYSERLLSLFNQENALEAAEESNSAEEDATLKTLADNAALVPDPVGGIDLNPTNIQFEERGRGVKVMTPHEMDLIKQGLTGVSPFIIDIRPISAAQILSQLDVDEDASRSHSEDAESKTAILLGRQS